MLPLVTVVIPTYNKSQFIEKTLMSVTRQTYENTEIILVDNGSTDDTRSRIQDFTSRNKGNFKIINLENNLGPSNARNKGILASSGKYVFFLDGDDIFLPEKISVQVKFMEENLEVGLTITPYIIYSPETNVLRLIRNTNPDLLISNWLNMTGFGGSVESTGCIRSDEIKPTLLYDTSLMGSEGLDFILRWSENSTIGILPKPLTIYRLSPNQLHLDISRIKENAARVASKYAKSEEQQIKISNMQNAFFKLSELRALGKVRLFLSIVVSVLSFDLYGIRMALAISKRNVLAIFFGFQYRKRIQTLMSSLE
jgi:glycosyltransferase involved in cell wall biosynthesis